MTAKAATATRPLTPAQVGQRHRAPLKHAARSSTALAPLVVSMKKGLLARMGLRQRDLTWAGREVLDTYCRAKAKVLAVDLWLETHPMITSDGEPAAVLKIYFVALNASVRALETLRGIVGSMRAEDCDLAAALAELDRDAGELKR